MPTDSPKPRPLTVAEHPASRTHLMLTLGALLSRNFSRVYRRKDLRVGTFMVRRPQSATPAVIWQELESVDEEE